MIKIERFGTGVSVSIKSMLTVLDRDEAFDLLEKLRVELSNLLTTPDATASVSVTKEEPCSMSSDTRSSSASGSRSLPSCGSDGSDASANPRSNDASPGPVARAATEEFLGPCSPMNHGDFNRLLDLMVHVYRVGRASAPRPETPVRRADFDAAAHRIVKGCFDYVEETAACPFCEMGHVPADEPEDHDDECPLRGFELTKDVEALVAYVAARPGSADETSGNARVGSDESTTPAPSTTTPARGPGEAGISLSNEEILAMDPRAQELLLGAVYFEVPVQCSYCDAPAVVSIATRLADGHGDERNACDEHEMQAQLEALRGPMPTGSKAT
jgi:hypothetical protein